MRIFDSPIDFRLFLNLLLHPKLIALNYSSYYGAIYMLLKPLRDYSEYKKYEFM
jgi:hypothetical protein